MFAVKSCLAIEDRTSKSTTRVRSENRADAGNNPPDHQVGISTGGLFFAVNEWKSIDYCYYTVVILIHKYKDYFIYSKKYITP
jgi:hypothetical protein